VQQSRKVIGKVFSLTQRGSDFPGRVRNKFGGWLGRFSPRCTIGDVRDASTLEFDLASLFPSQERHVVSESCLAEEKQLQQKQSRVSGPLPFAACHNGTETLGRVCYLVTRYLRPSRVVETGVAHGITSTYILRGLADNAHGTLHSIDLPPLVPDAQRHVGQFIPHSLRNRWTLTIGSARKALPRILDAAGAIDIFVHDSLHTYFHMKWELETSLAALRAGGVLIADDIEGNQAFEEMTRHPSVASWVVIRQQGKDAICGVLRTKS
jgi:predicted O-methyltransferase YrrM